MAGGFDSDDRVNNVLRDKGDEKACRGVHAGFEEGMETGLHLVILLHFGNLFTTHHFPCWLGGVNGAKKAKTFLHFGV